LTGAWGSGSLKFQVDKNIGMNQARNVCAMRSFTVTPLGTGRIATEWQDAACGTGKSS
jgi:hypothetical protein